MLRLTWLLLLVSLPTVVSFTGSAVRLPLRKMATGSGLRVAPSTCIKMAVDPVVQGVTAGLTGITAAVTILYTIERQGVRSAERMDAQLRTKLESKIDGGDAENKFSGTDQTLDDLIANMEAAQDPSKPKIEKEKVATKVVVKDDNDGW